MGFPHRIHKKKTPAAGYPGAARRTRKGAYNPPKEKVRGVNTDTPVCGAKSGSEQSRALGVKHSVCLRSRGHAGFHHWYKA